MICHPRVISAIERAAADGTSFGAPNPHETELAELVTLRFRYCVAELSMVEVQVAVSGVVGSIGNGEPLPKPVGLITYPEPDKVVLPPPMPGT